MEYLHVLTSVNMENYPADMSPNFYKALNYDVTSVIMSIKWYRQKDKDCYQKRNRKKRGQKYFNETKLQREEYFAKLFQKFNVRLAIFTFEYSTNAAVAVK